jgi:hypothetical protein
VANRKRAARRARVRLEEKEARDFQRALADRGIMKRIDRVREAVAPGAPVFWYILKRRIAARESVGAIDSLDIVRDLAMAVLRQEGHDMSGIVLKVFWRPPVLAFDPVPEHTQALEVVEQVRATEHGRERLGQIRALGG